MGDYDNVNPADIRYAGPVQTDQEKQDKVEEKENEPTGTYQESGYEQLAPGSHLNDGSPSDG